MQTRTKNKLPKNSKFHNWGRSSIGTFFPIGDTLNKKVKKSHRNIYTLKTIYDILS